MTRTCFIVNPVSAAGKTGRWWPRVERVIRRLWGRDFEVAFTERPWHAAELTSRALRRGCLRVVSVGGDGTLNEVVNGFFDRGRFIQPQAALGLLELGTGADFAKSLPLPKKPEEVLEIIRNGRSRKIDLGLAEFTGTNGTVCSRYFVNILDFGLGGAVVERVNRASKRWGGKAAFLKGILVTLATYKNKTIRFQLDDGPWQTRKLNNFIVANGRYFGGGLLPAPQADLSDGKFDIVFLGDVGRLEAVLNLSKLRKGTHFENPKVSGTRAARVQAESEEPVFIDIDGEFVGTLPIKILVLPQILPILIH